MVCTGERARGGDGKYLQVGRPPPPPPFTAAVAAREWSLFLRKRIYLGRTKTGFYGADRAASGPIIKLNVKTNRNLPVFTRRDLWRE